MTDKIELNGKIYIAVESPDSRFCDGCTFEHKHKYCVSSECRQSHRADGRDVIFVEKKEEAQLNNEDNNTEDKSIDVDESTNDTKTESLDSLFNQIVLLQKENDSLVEQKEQLVNKISANTQAINILKDKMQHYLNQIGNVTVGSDKADVVEEGKILDITDWQDLKVGDVVEITSVHKGTLSNGYEKFIGAVATVLSVDDPKYQNLEVLAINTRLWIDGFKFVSRPNK